jgi:hypothetical protein
MKPILTFIHLSDIHFGQEKKGGHVVYHDDIRRTLIEDVAALSEQRSKQGFSLPTGIIVTGDIAFSGTKAQYDKADAWLAELAEAAQCEKTSVQVVPGNHDVNEDLISAGAKLMLTWIKEKREDALNQLISNHLDCEVLYGRFAHYSEFAGRYNCLLNIFGGHTGEKLFNLGAGKQLRFLGMNSAIVSWRPDAKGKLLLGAKQIAFDRLPLTESVILSHHPIDWFEDQSDAARYLRSRASILMSGHEHLPKVEPEKLGDRDFLTIRAGATTPPFEEAPRQYTYNFVDFSLDESGEKLCFAVQPRKWNENETAFIADLDLVGEERKIFHLRCPQFRTTREIADPENLASSAEREEQSMAQHSASPSPEPHDAATDVLEFQKLRYTFFKELSQPQRLAVLIELEALPKHFSGSISLSTIDLAFENARNKKSLELMQATIKKALGKN